jgi:hypothetical protein
MSYQKISSQNIDQLLESYPNITFHSRLIKPIIQADIAFHLKLRPDKSTFFDDPKKYFPYQYYIGGKQNASYNFKEFFIQHGVRVEYIQERLLPFLFYAFLYEKEIELPEAFWYGKDELGLASEIYCMTPKNWVTITPYPISRTDYLKVMTPRSRNVLYTRSKNEFAYQTLENLIDLFSRMKSLKPFLEEFERYFPGERITMKYLIGVARNINEISGAMRVLLQKYNDYSNRRNLIKHYLQNQRSDNSLFRATETFDIEVILCYPAYHFEEAILRGKLRINDEFYNQTIWYYIDETFSDPMLSIVSRQGIGEMILRKDPALLHYNRETILRSIGYYGFTMFEDRSGNNFELIERIRASFNEEKFAFNNRFENCKNSSDFYMLEPFHGFIITFGTFFNFVCYSPEDLAASFRVPTPRTLRNRMQFSKPDQPAFSFTNEQVKQLETIIVNQNPVNYPQFRIRTEPIREKISIGLTTTLGEDEIVEVFEEWRRRASEDANQGGSSEDANQGGSSEDANQGGASEDANQDGQNMVEKMISIFMPLFYAGMKQRTWAGGDVPYPMSKRDMQQGVPQDEIDIRMAPYLTEFNERVFDLDPTSRDFIESIPAIWSADPYARYSLSITEFIDQTTGKNSKNFEGEFCVGNGSFLMIETAYYYLTMLLGYKIPHFDYSLFEPESIHRA